MFRNEIYFFQYSIEIIIKLIRLYLTVIQITLAQVTHLELITHS